MPLQTPPLSLYVHFPWCRSKCPYCDFNSHALKGALPGTRYVDALLADLDRDLDLLTAPRTIETVFLGGGTPSLFQPEHVARLLRAVERRIPVSSAVEITMEANPGTLERGSLAGYREAGVNRLSLGAQSFSDHHLHALGRIHTSGEIEAAADEARRGGFDNLNLDIMFALSGQSVEEAVEDIRRAVALCPSHISHYQLTLEPNTRFYHSPPPLPGDEVACDMQGFCQALLGEAGYRQYEVSAYAKPGFQCRHNMNYWRYGDYLGIGAGAHGKLTDVDRERIVRLVKPMHPLEYMNKATTQGTVARLHEVPLADRVFEFMLNALRLPSGFEERLFEAHTGSSAAEHAESLETAIRLGLLTRHGDTWRATSLGFRFLNDLLAVFLPAESHAAHDERLEGTTA